MSQVRDRARQFGAFIALLVATLLLLRSVHAHYPLQHWLFFRYATYWVASSVLSLSAFSLGHATLRTRLGADVPLLERLALAFALGVFELELLLFVTGILGMYGPVLFFALPLAGLALGGRALLRDLSRASRHLRARVFNRGPTPLGWAIIALGILSLVALYLPVLTAANISFDARWRHLTLAEQYVLHGGIRRFPEGWVFGASPQLTPLLYAWGFMLPGSDLFDRAILSGHIEFVIFLWTTFLCIPVLVRRLAPRSNPALSWVARFLFPGTFLYDSNLSTGADHIGALFAVPLFLLCVRMWRAPSVRVGALLGAFIAAAICAKETTALLLAPFPIALVATRFAVDAVGSLRRRANMLPRLLAGVSAGVSTVVLTSPHWLKNLIWYGDPLYPNLFAHFADHPWSPPVEYAYKWALRAMLWAPTKDLKGLEDALDVMLSFSFHPHAWNTMHRDWPVYGSLFTLLILVLPFLRKTWRIWGLVAFVEFSLFAWFWVHHEDRHLQALVPLTAAMVAACACLVIEQSGKLARAGLVLLFGTQIVWGADIYFYPTHSMIGAAPIKAVAELFARGYDKHFDQRFDLQMEQQRLAKALPLDAVVLMHEQRTILGIQRQAVFDFYGDQYAIDYTTLSRPDRIYEKLRSLGVTHIAWRRGASEAFTPIAGDIVFYDFVYRFGRHTRSVGGFSLTLMPKGAPKAGKSAREVAVLGCGTEYATGMYDVNDLKVPAFGPDKHYPKPRKALEAVGRWQDRSMAIVVDSGCSHAEAALPFAKFQMVTTRGVRWGRGYQIWLRR